MTFRIGQKVVCVDDRDGMFSTRRYLALNAVYTIRGFCENTKGEVGVLLDEVRPDLPCLPNGQERGFYIARFRPAVQRKTDISIFKKMLTPQGVEA